MSEIKIFCPHPDEVVYQLEKAPRFRYRSDVNAGFATVAAMPILYKYVVNSQRIPPFTDCADFLYGFAEPRAKEKQEEEVKQRARKLTQDFFRDLHTFGLLAQEFASVSYEKGLDIGFNVDYIAQLKSYLVEFLKCRENQVGVQASMMHPKVWARDRNWLQVKEERRQRRLQAHPEREIKEWTGEIFWLTNKERAYELNVNSVWLFGPNHVKDLVEEIKARFQDSGNSLGVQIEHFDDF